MSEKIGFRLLHVAGSPYMLVYRTTNEVEIVKVFDQRRNPEDMV